MQQSPRLFERARSRWTLTDLRQVLPWAAQLSLPGLQRVLRRLGVRYKRGRRYVHSPDLDYRQKVARITRLLRLAAQHPHRIVVLYQDELTYYRKPTVAQGYAVEGGDGPHAVQGTGRDQKRRIASSLHPATGQVVSWQRSKFDRQTLLRYFLAVAAAYPAAYRVYLVVDNWPVHFHPQVLAGLAGSKVRLVALPTYAPWLNPVEKVWRKLYQEILHLHPWVGEWTTLQEAVQTWLDQWTRPSPELLRYVGLSPD